MLRQISPLLTCWGQSAVSWRSRPLQGCPGSFTSSAAHTPRGGRLPEVGFQSTVMPSDGHGEKSETLVGKTVVTQ